MEEVLKKNLEGWCIGTQAADVQLQERRQQDVPSCPCDVVCVVESVPAIVSAKHTKCDNAITHSKYAEQCHFLSQRNLEVPVQKSGQDSSKHVLRSREDAGDKDVGPFVEAMELIALQSLNRIKLVPECRYRLAAYDRSNAQGDTVGCDVANGDPGCPEEYS